MLHFHFTVRLRLYVDTRLQYIYIYNPTKEPALQLQNISNPLVLGALLIRNFPLFHLLVLSRQTEPQDEAEENGSGGHDGVCRECDLVTRGVLLVVKVWGPNLGDCVMGDTSAKARSATGNRETYRYRAS